MARGKKYSPEDIERGLQALAEHGGNSAAASRATGIPATTLRGWKTKEFVDEFVEVRREKRSQFIDEVWGAAKEALHRAVQGLSSAKAKEAAVMFGIFVDKALVMGGEPETISETKIIDVRSDLERKLRQAVGAGAESGVSEEPE